MWITAPWKWRHFPFWSGISHSEIVCAHFCSNVISLILFNHLLNVLILYASFKLWIKPWNWCNFVYWINQNLCTLPIIKKMKWMSKDFIPFSRLFMKAICLIMIHSKNLSYPLPMFHPFDKLFIFLASSLYLVISVINPKILSRMLYIKWRWTFNIIQTPQIIIRYDLSTRYNFGFKISWIKRSSANRLDYGLLGIT